MTQKTITLIVEDKTFKHLRSALSVRGMCGEVAGPIEAALFKILTEMEKGSPTVFLSLKRDPT